MARTQSRRRCGRRSTRGRLAGGKRKFRGNRRHPEAVHPGAKVEAVPVCWVSYERSAQSACPARPVLRRRRLEQGGWKCPGSLRGSSGAVRPDVLHGTGLVMSDGASSHCLACCHPPVVKAGASRSAAPGPKRQGRSSLKRASIARTFAFYARHDRTRAVSEARHCSCSRTVFDNLRRRSERIARRATIAAITAVVTSVVVTLVFEQIFLVRLP